MRIYKPTIKKPRYDSRWLSEMKLQNIKRLDKILATPNYQEIYGRLHYGDSWTCILDGNHPDRVERNRESTSRSQRRLKGEAIPFRIGANRWACVQYDKEGNKLNEYKGGAIEYIESMGWSTLKANTIVNCCKGTAKSAYGFNWSFKDKNIWTKYKNQ